MTFLTSYEGWKIYQTLDGYFYARRGNKWISSQPTLGEVKQIIWAKNRNRTIIPKLK